MIRLGYPGQPDSRAERKNRHRRTRAGRRLGGRAGLCPDRRSRARSSNATSTRTASSSASRPCRPSSCRAVRSSGQTGLGKQDLEANTPARADTPYFIGNLSQIFGSALLLQKCYDQDTLELKDQIIRWVPGYTDEATTVGQLLTHQSPAGSYALRPGALLEPDRRHRRVRGPSLPSCARRRNLQPRGDDPVGARTRARRRRSTLAARRSRPPSSPVTTTSSRRWRGTTASIAASRCARRCRNSRPTPRPASITTALDLAAFDNALRPPGLLSRDALTVAWTQAGGALAHADRPRLVRPELTTTSRSSGSSTSPGTSPRR